MSGLGDRKWVFIRPSLLGLVAIVLAALGIRLALILQGWPLVDSDEGTMGLMAMHIAYRGEWPIFFYGQSYMGSSEAYLGAYFFRLFGVSSAVLRLGMLLFFALFLVSLYALTRRLYSRNWALLVLTLLIFGSNPMMIRQIVAVGGNAEMLVAGTLLMLVATQLAWHANNPEKRREKKRLLLFAFWGVLVGFGLWSHLLVAPFVLMSLLIIVVFCLREIFSYKIFFLLLGFLVGAVPLILFNLVDLDHNSLLVFLTIHSISGHYHSTILQQLHGAFLTALPTATGLVPLCAPEQTTFQSQNWQCLITHGGWSLGQTLLWVIALVMVLTGLWHLWKIKRKNSLLSEEAHQQAVREVGRLALLGVAAATMMLYVLSPNSAFFPVPTARYLYGFLAVTPALLWPLWAALRATKPWTLRLWRTTVSLRLSWLSRGIGALGLLLVLGVYVFGTVITFTGMPKSQAAMPNTTSDPNLVIQLIDQHYDLPDTQKHLQAEQTLIQYLEQRQIVHIYSDYWTCNRLIFQSGENVICRVLSDINTHEGYNRYDPYRAIVDSDPLASYVYEIGSKEDQMMQSYFRNAPESYELLESGGYHIYHMK